MESPDYDALFRDYAKAYERSLGDSVDVDAIRALRDPLVALMRRLVGP